MSQRVPEFALVVGLFLGGTLFVAGALLTDDLLTTLLLALLVAYPFVGFAVVRTPDPTTVLVPRPTLVVGALLGLAAAVGGALSEPLPGSLFLGLGLGLAVFLPAFAYVLRVAPPTPPVSPGRVVAASVGAGAVVLAGAVAADALAAGAADALLVALAGSLYGHRVGFRLDPRRRLTVLAAGALAGVTVAAAGLYWTGGVGEWVLVAVALLLGPALFVALTAAR